MVSVMFLQPDSFFVFHDTDSLDESRAAALFKKKERERETGRLASYSGLPDGFLIIKQSGQENCRDVVFCFLLSHIRNCVTSVCPGNSHAALDGRVKVVPPDLSPVKGPFSWEINNQSVRCHLGTLNTLFLKNLQ